MELPFYQSPPAASPRKMTEEEAEQVYSRLSNMEPVHESRKKLEEKYLIDGIPEKPRTLKEEQDSVQRLYYDGVWNTAQRRRELNKKWVPRKQLMPQIKSDADMENFINRMYYTALENQQTKLKDLESAYLPEAPRKVAPAKEIQELVKRLTQVPPQPQPDPLTPSKKLKKEDMELLAERLHNSAKGGNQAVVKFI
jgi:hypothetical protein